MKVKKMKLNGFDLSVMALDEETGQHVAMVLPVGDFLEGRSVNLTMVPLGDDLDDLTPQELDERAANAPALSIPVSGYSPLLPDVMAAPVPGYHPTPATVNPARMAQIMAQIDAAIAADKK